MYVWCACVGVHGRVVCVCVYMYKREKKAYGQLVYVNFNVNSKEKASLQKLTSRPLGGATLASPVTQDSPGPVSHTFNVLYEALISEQ